MSDRFPSEFLNPLCAFLLTSKIYFSARSSGQISGIPILQSAWMECIVAFMSWRMMNLQRIWRTTPTSSTALNFAMSWLCLSLKISSSGCGVHSKHPKATLEYIKVNLKECFLCTRGPSAMEGIATKKIPDWRHLIHTTLWSSFLSNHAVECDRRIFVSFCSLPTSLPLS